MALAKASACYIACHASTCADASRRRGPSRIPDPKLQQQCFIARDGKGQALAYAYLEEEPGRRAAAKLITRDEARRIAAIAKLSELMRGSPQLSEA